MAKSALNSALNGISGAIDRWVYRQVGGRTIICRRPESTQEPSAAQMAVRERFIGAQGFATAALADPLLAEFYGELAETRGVQARMVAVSDYLNLPEVDSIDLAGYHGAVGDPIRVVAKDDVGVTAVTVTLRAVDQTVLEQGPASLLNGVWTYAASTARSPSETVKITASAVDRAQHASTKTATWS